MTYRWTRRRRWRFRRWVFGTTLASAVVGLEVRPWWVLWTGVVAALPLLWRVARRWLGERTALYDNVADDGTLLYVGISNDPERRFEEHTDDERWWSEGTPEVRRWYRTRLLALAAEKAAIKAEGPIFNTVHNGRNPRRIDWRAVEDAA